MNENDRFPMRAIRAGLLVGALVASTLVPMPAAADETNWATKRAIELTDDGEAREKAGLVDAAVHLYREAISIDPTYGEAYLALARLRTKMGDPDEAEITYAAGIDHVFGFSEAYVARADLLRGEGKMDAALADLLSASALKPDDLHIAEKLSEAAISAGKLPLALAAARRLAVLAHASGDAATEKSARVTAVALSRIVGPIDPVGAGADRCAVRRAIARASSAWK
jgi:tetratricopeptide (TPR) repeat protein